jgi:2-oxoisovalerate dehydrogenase E2 component (dihydrolipoyl transacylase)
MKIELPHVGESVTEGIIGRWLKQVGDRVEKYDPLVEVVTDKVNMEMPSPVSGVLTSIVAEEGQTVPMGDVIAEIRVESEADGGDVGSSAPPAAATPDQVIDRTGVLLKDVAPVGPTGSGNIPSANTEPPTPSGDVKVRQTIQRYSPAVSRLAADNGVDLSQVHGTGIGGRVTRQDVEDFLSSGQTAGPESSSRETSEDISSSAQNGETDRASPPSQEADEERIPLTPVRRIVAANMVRSSTEIPQAWSYVEVDVSGLVQRRESQKGEFQLREGVNLTYLPFAIKAVADALRQNRLLNSSWDGDAGGNAIVVKRRINIGVAVAAPDGLVVPVVRDADMLSVANLAKAIDELTDRARRGKLVLEDVEGGTFTVNNTGALGSVVSRPLVSYPQAAIITTEAIVKRPVVANDAIAIRSMMNVCLSFDHRILDGSSASAFLNDVKQRLEAIGPDTGIY